MMAPGIERALHDSCRRAAGVSDVPEANRTANTAQSAITKIITAVQNGTDL